MFVFGSVGFLTRFAMYRWSCYASNLIAAVLILACPAEPGNGSEERSTTDPVYFSDDMVPIVDDDGDIADGLDGWWRSDGYGFILKIEDAIIEQYLQTASYCVRESHTREDILEQFAYFDLINDGTVRFASYPGGTVYTFLPVTEAPAACLRAESASNRESFEVFWQYFEENYAFFAKRHIDWTTRGNRVRAELDENVSDEQLIRALSQLLAGLNDAHTEIIEAEVAGEIIEVSGGRGRTRDALFANFEAQSDIESFAEFDRAWIQAYRAGISEMLGDGGTRTARGQLDWGPLTDDIGYLHLLTFQSFAREGGLEESIRAIHAALDEALTAMSDKNAIIVDVTQNRGGYDRLALAVAQHFNERPTLAFTKRAHGALQPPQAFEVQPTEGVRFTGPIYVLTSDVTISAGEIFVLAMTALPNVTIVGTATRGALSDELARTLPNGWWFGMSNEIYLDHNGVSHEATGIPPQIPIEVFDLQDLFGSAHVGAIEVLLDQVTADINSEPHR